MPEVVGSEPTPQQKAAFAAAENLTPEKSLDRIRELAKFVFTNVAVVGTLLAGLGLFTDLGDVLEHSWKVGGVPLAVLLIGLSLFCASCAIWPKMSNVDLARLEEVQRWYRRQIIRRGIWMILSLFCFSAGILAATFTGIGFSDDPEKPSISGSWTGFGKDAAVKVAVKAEDVASDWVMVTTAYARKPAAAPRRILYDSTRPGTGGEVTVAGEVQVEEGVEKVEVSVRLYPGDVNDEPESESDLTLRRGPG